jgi:Flp pilus assembly pilin Flp
VTTRLVSDRPDPTAAFPPPTTPSLRGALRRLLAADDGAATAEYAIVIMAAVGFAGLLVVIMRSDEVRGTLSDLVRSALTVG